MIILQIIVSLIVIYFSADFWRRGGNGNVVWRVCVGGIIGLGKTILFWNPLAMIYWLYFWMATAGASYGDNSPLRIMWSWILRRDRQDMLVQTLTRATCGFVWSLAALCFIPFGGSWIRWICYSGILTIINCTVVLHSSDVEVSERLAGGTVALAILV
jgi:hypothetical protein